MSVHQCAVTGILSNTSSLSKLTKANWGQGHILISVRQRRIPSFVPLKQRTHKNTFRALSWGFSINEWWFRRRIVEEGGNTGAAETCPATVLCRGGRINSEGMKGGMKTGSMHGCLWMQQHCNAEVRRWRHGHCGWRTGGGGGGGGRAQSGFLSWHTLRCPFPARLLKNAQLHPLQLKTLLSQPRQRPRQAARPNISFLQPSHVSCQTLPGVFKGKLRFITTRVLLSRLWRSAVNTIVRAKVIAEIWEQACSQTNYVTIGVSCPKFNKLFSFKSWNECTLAFTSLLCVFMHWEAGQSIDN